VRSVQRNPDRKEADVDRQRRCLEQSASSSRIAELGWRSSKDRNVGELARDFHMWLEAGAGGAGDAWGLGRYPLICTPGPGFCLWP